MVGKIGRNAVIIALLVCLAGSFVWWNRLPSASVPVTVPAGASAREIADLLHEARVISFRGFFVRVVGLTGSAKKLKAGTYFLSPRSSMLSIIKILTEGRARYVRVTIPEGFTARQVAERFSSLGVTDGGKFLSLVTARKLEGYLYPETYFFEPNTPGSVVADVLVREFEKHFTPEFEARARELGLSRQQAVTLASIIEREAVRPEERPLISGVFHNRLKKRWYLESCATVLYALGRHKERLTYRDLRVNSPYNTYRRYGLPPGPISNPGIASLRAALYPSATGDMFFVASSSGAHTFSRYFKQHINSKIKAKRKKELSR